MATDVKQESLQKECDRLRDRLKQLEAECEQQRIAVRELRAKEDTYQKALHACLPPECTVEEAAAWVDLIQQHRDGKCVSFHEVVKEMERRNRDIVSQGR